MLFFNFLTTSLLFYIILPVLRIFFIKFCLSFKLSKRDFFKDKVEYVGYDLTTNGNRPATSKFPLLQDWPLPPHSIYLL